MKKYIYYFLLGFTLTTSTSFAADIYGICMTDIAPTTTFVIETKGSNIEFEVIHHNGGTYAPFWSSLVVPNDILNLSERADLIQKMGAGFKSTWPSKNCSWTGKNKFSCFGSDDIINVQGITVKPWALYSAAITDSSFAGDYNYIEMSVGFTADDKSQSYTMRYQEHECILSDVPITKFKTMLKKIK
jgi:hypothetical protein